jgi:hypothetical protein
MGNPKFSDIYSFGLQKSDEYATPPEAVLPLIKYLPQKNNIIWECTDTTGNISGVLKDHGYNVISTSNDFFSYEKPLGDVIVTNPPYSLKTQFLEKCYEFGIPFALLLPITALEGVKRQKLFRENYISLILFDRRIEFSNKKNGAWFAIAWFLFGIDVPEQLNFEELRRE